MTSCGVVVRRYRFEDCSHVQDNKNTSQKRQYCIMNITEHYRTLQKTNGCKTKSVTKSIRQYMLQRFSAKICKHNVIFLETFINYFK